jgi:glycerate kinase
MALRVLIAPDKFKGTLTAAAAAEAMARGWRQARPSDVIERLPISDGGDGFGEILSCCLGAKARTLKTRDAAGRAITAHWWWEPRTRTAIIESARIIGLALLPPGHYHPFALDTSGLGAVIRAAAGHGARHGIIGIGGSATNDGGFGLARALGWQFLDAHGRAIEPWPRLADLTRIIPPKKRRWFPRLTVAVDVQNRLLGAQGCTRIYGPQKGLRPEDFPAAEAALRRLAKVVRQQLGLATGLQPGSGAAGGLGFGLMAFLGAQMQPGFGLLARHAQLPRRLKTVKLVVTGEGALDASSMMGKGVGELAQLCRHQGVPCLGLAGVVKPSPRLRRLFARTGALVDLTSLADAQAHAAGWLEKLACAMAAGVREA